jgi:hypothetical protein
MPAMRVMIPRRETRRTTLFAVVATLHAGVDLSEENLLHDIRSALAADDETSR